MIESINFEWKKMSHSVLFRICLIYGAFLAVGEALWAYSNVFTLNRGIYDSVVANGDLYIDFYETGILECWLGCEGYSYYNQLFIKTLPLIAAIPYSYSLRSEWDSGYSTQIITKTGRFRYFISKVFVCFLSGGIASDFPLLLSLLIAGTYAPMIGTDPASYQTTIIAGKLWYGLSQHYPFIYAICFSIIVFIFGGLYAWLGMIISMLVNNRFVSILFPMMLHLSLTFIWITFGLDFKYIPEAFLNPEQGGSYYLSLPVIIMIEIASLTVLLILSIIRLHRIDEL